MLLCCIAVGHRAAEYLQCVTCEHVCKKCFVVGRMFECEPVQMLHSLDKVLALPNETLVWPGKNFFHTFKLLSKLTY